MHEKSITVEFDGKHVNLPTVVGGKHIGAKEAVKRYRAGKLKPLGGKTFSSRSEAVKAAKARSKRAGDKRDNPFRKVK